MYYLLAWTFGDYLTNITKLGTYYPRPFWASDEIQTFECTTQFGNPSGHAARAMGFPVLIWLDYYENYNSGRFSGIYTKVVLLILGVGGGILVGYIRVLLGVHTIC